MRWSLVVVLVACEKRAVEPERSPAPSPPGPQPIVVDAAVALDASVKLVDATPGPLVLAVGQPLPHRWSREFAMAFPGSLLDRTGP